MPGAISLVIKVNFRSADYYYGEEILFNAKSIEPILEIWTDIPTNKIVEIFLPAKDKKFNGIPLPLY
jgi:hypothetical protein